MSWFDFYNEGALNDHRLVRIDKLAKYWVSKEMAMALLYDAFCNNNDAHSGNWDKVKSFLIQF